MAKITPKGYELKNQNEYFTEELALYRQIDPAWSMDASTPDGLKAAHDAEVFGALDETLQQAYNSKDPNKAQDVDLDTIALINNIYREQGAHGSVKLILTGVPGTIIDRGKRVSSRTTGSRWVIEQGVSIDTTGQAEVNAFCELIGMIEADANTITQIVDTVGGWTGVTNPENAIVGRDQELDHQLRVRRAVQVGNSGSSQMDSLYGSIFGVQDVRRVKIYENDTGSDATDPVWNPHGLPAHAMCILVDGGTDDDVAQAIYDKRNPGTPQYKSPTASPVVEHVPSKIYPSSVSIIAFNRPKYIDMILKIKIKNDGTLPSDVEELIREAFMEFAAGDLVPADVGFKIQGFDIGEDVPYSTMFTPVNKIIGQYGNSYIEDLTLNTAKTNVVIAYDQLSRWSTSNITVEVIE